MRKSIGFHLAALWLSMFHKSMRQVFCRQSAVYKVRYAIFYVSFSDSACQYVLLARYHQPYWTRVVPYWLIHCVELMMNIKAIVKVTYVTRNDEVDTMVPFCFIDPWWRHQMETFSALLAICVGNSPVTKASDAELWCFLWSPPE